jgi:hypothetical protein
LAGLRLIGYAAVLAFLGWQLWRVRAGLADSLRAVGWGNALAAGALAAVGGVPSFFGWRVLLAGLGTRLPLRAAAWVFFLGGVTRYLPGGIWPTVAHAAMARPLGEPPARLAGAFLTSQGLGVVSGLFVGLLALPRLVAADPWWWLLLPVAVAASVPLLVPRLLGTLLTTGARLLRRPGRRSDGRPDGRSDGRPDRRSDGRSDGRGAGPGVADRPTLLRATGLMLLGWLISGSHVAVLAVALGADPGAAVLVGVGGFALAVVAGIFAVVLPTGFGVREVALALTLASLLSGSDLVTLVALSRVLLTVGDVGSTAAVLAALALTGGAGPNPSGSAGPGPAADPVSPRLEGVSR